MFWERGNLSIGPIITAVFRWEQMPEAFERASYVDEALNGMIRY